MEVKDYTIVGVGITFLILSLLTGAMVFYAALLLTTIIFGLDGFRLMYRRFSLSRRLTVRRSISRRDLFLGTSAEQVTTLELSGRRKQHIQIQQPIDAAIKVFNPIPGEIELTAGTAAVLALEFMPAKTGEFNIEPMRLLIESWFFKDAIKLGRKEKINVHIGIGSIGSRSGVSPGGFIGKSDSSAEIAKTHSGTGSPEVRSSFTSGSYQQYSDLIRSKHTEVRGGTDFSLIRNYAPGDDIKHIDWVKSARIGTPLVREYEEDLPLPVFFLLDVDITMGTGGISSELSSVVNLTALLINKLTTDSNMFGLACFTKEDMVKYQSLGIGRDHLSKVRDMLTALKPEDKSAVVIKSDISLHVANSTRNALHITNGLDTLGQVLDETIQEYAANVKSDGFFKAILKVSRSINTPCQLVIMTNLSMGFASLMNGVRIAKYYGHSVTVVLTPHIWYNGKELIDAETCYEKYRQTKDTISKIRGSGSVKVIDLCSNDRPEDAIYRNSTYRLSAGLRR